jgi:hypothetical protein
VTRNYPMTKVRMTLPIAILGPAVAAMIATAIGFSYMLIGHRTVAIDRDRVRVEGAMYSTEVSRAAIDGRGIRLVDLDRTPELAPTHRTNGFGLPGLQEGWFELANGKRAFALLTDTSHVVAIPTSSHWLLLSGTDGARIVARLTAGQAASRW